MSEIPLFHPDEIPLNSHAFIGVLKEIPGSGGWIGLYGFQLDRPFQPQKPQQVFTFYTSPSDPLPPGKNFSFPEPQFPQKEENPPTDIEEIRQLLGKLVYVTLISPDGPTRDSYRAATFPISQPPRSSA